MKSRTWTGHLCHPIDWLDDRLEALSAKVLSLLGLACAGMWGFLFEGQNLVRLVPLGLALRAFEIVSWRAEQFEQQHRQKHDRWPSP